MEPIVEVTERVARRLCELDIRVKRRWDTPAQELEAMLPAAIDFAWPNYLDQAVAAQSALTPSPDLKADNAALVERVAELESLVQWIDDELNDAAQADCECGVRWLNERASAEYLRGYPATEQSIGAIITKVRASLQSNADEEES